MSLKSYGVDIVDALTGQYLGGYDLTTMPTWVPQPFDEGWLESQVTNWGVSRRGSSFDIFAGGFIGISVSNDRIAMDEDTRFLRYGDEMISFTSMHPYATEQTLSGIFVSDHTGIKYYDVSQSNMLSGSRAKDVIQSQLYKPSAGEFVVEMPILYNMTGRNLAWLSPVYYVAGDTWQLKFIGIVSALDQSDVIVQDVTATPAKVGVEEASASFISLLASKKNLGTSIDGQLTGKWSYEVGGNTNYYVNITYGTTWKLLHGLQSNLPSNDWVELVVCDVGNHVNCSYIVVGSINEIIRFDVLDF
nr:hypothetical protein [Candidatus Njordarchaeota archaeon]